MKFSDYPPDWKQIVLRVAMRAGGRCECRGECGLHQTNPGPRRCIEYNGTKATFARGKVVLTTAHLCHDTKCADMTHLRHMCQRCHLRYDLKYHMKNARKTRFTKKAMRDLFEVLSTTSRETKVGGE